MTTARTRTYGEGCAAAHALDLVGERWALLLVRELLLGPKRFTDLRAGIAHGSPNVLAQRLRELEQAGIVRRRTLPPPAASRVYELTDWGLELEPVVTALGRWGARSPAMPHGTPMSLDSHVLAMRTMFDPARAGFDATYGLRLDDVDFRARVIGLTVRDRARRARPRRRDDLHGPGHARRRPLARPPTRSTPSRRRVDSRGRPGRRGPPRGPVSAAGARSRGLNDASQTPQAPPRNTDAAPVEGYSARFGAKLGLVIANAIVWAAVAVEGALLLAR